MEMLLLSFAVGLLGALLYLYTVWRRKSSTPKSLPPDFSSRKPSSKVEEDDGKPPLKIIFASQSGTGETLAFDLEKEAAAFGFSVEVVDIEEYEAEDLENEKFVLFLVATHGEGEPTDSCEEFYQWLSEDGREIDTELLDGVTFAVFGLGNRQYEFFNEMGIQFDKRVGDMGAERLVVLGQGDDDDDLEGDFEEWKSGMWSAARKKYIGEDQQAMEVLWESTLDMEVLAEADGEFQKAVNHQPISMDGKFRAYPCPLTRVYEARADTADGSTLHLEFDVEKTPLRYKTADNAGILPRNDYKTVAKFCKRLGVAKDTVFRLAHKAGARAHKFPTPRVCTVQNALLWYCDLTDKLRRTLVGNLAQYADSEVEKAELRRVSHADNKEEWQDWHASRSLLDVLNEFPSIQLPLHHFLELVPRLQPRYYTISSSSRVHPTSLHVTATIVRTALPNGVVHRGVCTTYLESLQEGKSHAMLFVKDSSFRLPRALATTPVIMVGPGTGFAPFRGFLQDASALHKQEQALGTWSLFFGCRYRSKDHIYRELMEAAVEDGALSHLHVAYSRDGPEKVYVQDRIREQADTLLPLLKSGAHVYVCGGTSMGRGVRDAFQVVLQKGGMDEGEAHDFLRSMQTSNRYVQELWGD